MENDNGLSHVYVLEGAPGICKIGIAEDVQLRVKALQTGHPETLTLHLALPMLWEFTRPVERECHKILRGDRRVGEWFTVSPGLAVQTVKVVASRLVPDIDRDTARRARQCIMDYRAASDRRASLLYKLVAAQQDRIECERRESQVQHLMRVEEGNRERAIEAFTNMGAPKELWGTDGMPMSNAASDRTLAEAVLMKPVPLQTRDERQFIEAAMACRHPL